MGPRCLVVALMWQLARGADKRYGVDTGMKIHGNQGKSEDSPKVAAAVEFIRCDVCKTLVQDLWNKTAGVDYDPGEDGRIVTTEDGVLALIEDTCRGRAPLFTQMHEVLEVTGETANAKAMRFEFREALDGPSDWPAHIPKPLARINWATVAMKKACSSIVDEQEIEIATLIYLGVNAPRASNIDIYSVSDAICVTTSRACGEDQRRSTKVRTSTEFAHAAKGARRQAQSTEAIQTPIIAAEQNRVDREHRAVFANKAARGVKCELCLLLTEDLWAKALGLGSEGRAMTSEDQVRGFSPIVAQIRGLSALLACLDPGLCCSDILNGRRNVWTWRESSSVSRCAEPACHRRQPQSVLPDTPRPTRW
jgi:hypothetical protein